MTRSSWSLGLFCLRKKYVVLSVLSLFHLYTMSCLLSQVIRTVLTTLHAPSQLMDLSLGPPIWSVFLCNEQHEHYTQKPTTHPSYSPIDNSFQYHCHMPCQELTHTNISDFSWIQIFAILLSVQKWLDVGLILIFADIFYAVSSHLCLHHPLNWLRRNNWFCMCLRTMMVHWCSVVIYRHNTIHHLGASLQCYLCQPEAIPGVGIMSRDSEENPAFFEHNFVVFGTQWRPSCAHTVTVMTWD